MRTIPQSVGTALLIATLSLSAFADNGRGRHPYNHRPHAVRSHGGDWVAPLLFLGLAGAVLSASAHQSSPPPAPVTYVSPPPVYVPAPITYSTPVEVFPAPPPAPANTWYFCQSVGKYYPYAQHCPEGWQPVAGQR